MLEVTAAQHVDVRMPCQYIHIQGSTSQLRKALLVLCFRNYLCSRYATDS